MLLQNVPKEPRRCFLLVFNLHLSINKLRVDEVIRSHPMSNVREEEERSPAGLGNDQR